MRQSIKFSHSLDLLFCVMVVAAVASVDGVIVASQQSTSHSRQITFHISFIAFMELNSLESIEVNVFVSCKISISRFGCFHSVRLFWLIF